MAKMFYTIDEVAAKLGTTTDKVREMVEKGQLTEYRDRDKLVFKREQVDMYASSGKDGDDLIPLADSGELSLAADDSRGGSGGAGAGGATAGASTKDKSGISIFDVDDTEQADPSAQTQITQTGPGATAMDPGASGSGLLDLTREADDTSLGANLLDDVYKDGQGASGDTGAPAGAGGALFEPAGVASDVGGGGMPGMAMVAAEPYDGLWSGIGGGLALAMAIVTGLSIFVAILSMLGAGQDLAGVFAPNLMAVAGGLAVLVIACAGVGALVGRKG